MHRFSPIIACLTIALSIESAFAQFSVLHAFKTPGDGAVPTSGLIASGDNALWRYCRRWCERPRFAIHYRRGRK